MNANEVGAFEDDEIMTEIRQYRRELAERFGHDLKKIADHVHEEYENWKKIQHSTTPKQLPTVDPNASPSTAT